MFLQLVYLYGDYVTKIGCCRMYYFCNPCQVINRFPTDDNLENFFLMNVEYLFSMKLTGCILFSMNTTKCIFLINVT